MAILSGQFSKALESIEPSSADNANAPKAHQAVRSALTSADDMKDWGLNPVTHRLVPTRRLHPARQGR